MIELKAATKLITEVKKLAACEEFQSRHIMDPEKDFKRNRKLSFSDIVMYTIGNTKGPIGYEAERFLKYIDCEKISAAAICKARKKINYTAFQELFEASAKVSPTDKKYRGFKIMAVDGMKGELPKTLEFTEKYRISPQSNTPVFHAVSVFDVINEIFIRSEFHFGSANERELACELIEDVINTPEYSEDELIWVFDRGFPSLILLQELMSHGQKFVMRVSNHFLKEVNEFMKSGYVDREIHVSLSERRMATNRVKSDGECEFDIRCVRVSLPGGEKEILITNLDRRDFPKRHIKEIYRLRWGIETSFNYLKNTVFVEEFTSKSENGIKQEYYASLLVYNLTTCICGSIFDDIPKKN